MRYVIVCLMKDETLNFHEKLVNDICIKFNVKRQKLPAHFTIKAPFETDNVEEIEKLTEQFCSDNKAAEIKIEGFGHFRENVIFMNVKPSEEALKLNDSYINKLRKISWLQWKPNEKGEKVFHCTLVSKIPSSKYKPIYDYISSFNCNFKLSFDNISILVWENDKWVTYKSFELKINN